MMKKRVLYFSFLFIAMLALVACGSTNSNTTNSQNVSASNSQETFKFKIMSVSPSLADKGFGSTYRVMEDFTKRLEERSNGRITFEKFYSSQLVPQNEILDGLSAGIIDFALSSPGIYGDIVKSATFSTLPFWNDSVEKGLKILYHPEIQKLENAEYEKHGVKLLGYISNGTNGIVSTKPIKSVSDFKGLQIRTNSTLWNTWYKELGAVPINVSIPDLYEGLQRGVLDATPGPVESIGDLHIQEVAQYILRPVYYFFEGVYVSTGVWGKLPADLQELTLEVFTEIQQLTIDDLETHRKNFDEVVSKYDLKVSNLQGDELEKMIESSRIVWKEFASQSETNARMIEILEKEMGL